MKSLTFDKTALQDFNFRLQWDMRELRGRSTNNNPNPQDNNGCAYEIDVSQINSLILKNYQRFKISNVLFLDF